MSLLEHRELGTVVGATDIEAGDDASLRERDVGEVVVARQVRLGVG